MIATDTVRPTDSLGPVDRDLRLLLRIRHVEQALLRLFETGRLSGTTHTCIGQEHVPVALTPLLSTRDFVFSNHRSHGHYLARYDDVRGLLAEVLGRAGGVCAGVGGSQHLYRDRFISTGVQGENIAVATGAALHFQRARGDALALVYVGDGTWGQGVVYESLNIAALRRLPLVVVVENNGIAQSTPLEDHMAGDIAGRAAAFGARHLRSVTRDVDELRTIAAPLLAETRQHGGPTVLEFETARLAPHSKGDDTRSPAVVEALRQHDWAALYAARDPRRFALLDEAERAEVEALVAEIEALPEAQPPPEFVDAERSRGPWRPDE